MRLFTLFLLIAIATFNSCEKEEQAEPQELVFPVNPVDLPESARVDASELRGVDYRMARIVYTRNNSDEKADFDMRPCILTLQDIGCSSTAENCMTHIEEQGETLRFGNVVVASAGEPDRVSFFKIPGVTESRPDEFMLRFLENDVFTIIAGSSMEVYKQGENAYLRCENCPVSYEGVTYQNRTVTLTPK